MYSLLLYLSMHKKNVCVYTLTHTLYINIFTYTYITHASYEIALTG